MWCPCENPQYHTSTHFFDVAKNTHSELITFEILTRAAPKKLRKKCQKSRSGELGSQTVIYNYILWKRKKATRRDQQRSWRGKMVNARHTDLTVLYTIRLFQKKRKKYGKKCVLARAHVHVLSKSAWKITKHGRKWCAHIAAIFVNSQIFKKCRHLEWKFSSTVEKKSKKIGKKMRARARAHVHVLSKSVRKLTKHMRKWCAHMSAIFANSQIFKKWT